MVGDPGEGLLEKGEQRQAREDKPAGGGRNVKCLGASLACLIVGGIVFHGAIANGLSEALVFTASLGKWAAFFIVLLTAVLNLFMLPTFPIMIGAGVVFTKMYDGDSDMGGLVGTLAVFGGLWLGSMVAFMLGRTYLQEFARKELAGNQMLQVVNGMIAESGWTIVLLARMSPLLPAEVFNYACSLVSTLTPLQYGIGCMGSIVPVSFWVFTSAQAAEFAHSRGNGTATDAPQGGSTLIVLNVVIVVVLTFAFKVAYDRYKKKAQEAIAKAMGPRDFIARQADFSRSATEPCLGIPYYSERSLLMKCPSEGMVSWGEKIQGIPVRGREDNREWIQVGSGGSSRFLPMHCDGRQKDGMHAMCPHLQKLVKRASKFGPDQLVSHACVFSTPPKFVRAFTHKEISSDK